MKRILLSWLLLVWFTNGSNAQSIRKDYREMTGTEMNDYVAALNQMRSTGLGNNPANHHGSSNWIDFFGISHGQHFNSPIHTRTLDGGNDNGRWFLPWHRVFLLEYERELKLISGKDYLSIPYWDGRDDNNTGSSTFWHNGFLAPNKLSWSISRNVGGATLANSNTVTNILNQSTFINQNGIFDNFSRFLEIQHHNPGHGWIGGTMNTTNSPLDPIFFLHHCMVDKLWDDWEEVTPFIQSNININGGNQEIMIHYGGVSDGYRTSYRANNAFNRTVELPVYSNEQPYSRYWDTWYSDYATKSVIIHGYGSNLSFDMNDGTNPFTYRYVSATTPGGNSVTGHIYAGSVKRAGGNIIPSDWGGVRITNGTTSNFLAGGSIQFLPGFEAQYGSSVSAKIISTHNGLRQSAENNENLSQLSDEQTESLLVFPNPTSENITIKVPSRLQGALDSDIIDITGNSIISKHFEKNEYEFKVNVKSLKTGLYFCRVSAENGQSLTVKFIKE